MAITVRKGIYCLCILFMIAYDLNHYHQKYIESIDNQTRTLQAEAHSYDTLRKRFEDKYGRHGLTYFMVVLAIFILWILFYQTCRFVHFCPPMRL